MEVYLNKITGVDDAIVSMFYSKRTITRELEEDIRATCDRVSNRNGSIKALSPKGDSIEELKDKDDMERFVKWIDTLVKWGWKHITLLRFVDLSFSVYGLHRAGQD